MPFLSRLDLHHQNSGWASATYLTIDDKHYDITLNVSVITENDVIIHTNAWWTSSDIDQENRNTCSCLFQKGLLNYCWSCIRCRLITSDEGYTKCYFCAYSIRACDFQQFFGCLICCFSWLTPYLSWLHGEPCLYQYQALQSWTGMHFFNCGSMGALRRTPM